MQEIEKNNNNSYNCYHLKMRYLAFYPHTDTRTFAVQSFFNQEKSKMAAVSENKGIFLRCPFIPLFWFSSQGSMTGWLTGATQADEIFQALA